MSAWVDERVMADRMENICKYVQCQHGKVDIPKAKTPPPGMRQPAAGDDDVDDPLGTTLGPLFNPEEYDQVYEMPSAFD